MITAVFFSTSTCKHCAPFKKTFQDVLEGFEESEVQDVYRIVDKEPESAALAQEWQIYSVPTVLFVKDGVALDEDRIVGSISASELKNVIERLVQRDVLQESPGGSEASSSFVLRDTGESCDSKS